MGKSYKDQSRNKKIGVPPKQKDPGKKVRLEEFTDIDLDDDENDRHEGSH